MQMCQFVLGYCKNNGAIYLLLFNIPDKLTQLLHYKLTITKYT